ncbi:alpha/beta fold hydrolase [Amycolatopsis sp. cmx-11-51]|uniref:alpha/beta fold hydrolase n=1 Tax=unclassified Amycolatopsis TaxID=2618356 RepID=UPI0039E65985
MSYDRPGYGGSTPRRGRNAASVAGDVAQIADALKIERFAVFDHSGGGPHALACAALLPERVSAAVGVASMAPRDGEGLDWFEGMGRVGVESLTAALAGRTERRHTRHRRSTTPRCSPRRITRPCRATGSGSSMSSARRSKAGRVG